MAPLQRFGATAAARHSRLDPALKEFLDAVVIPALVKAYLLEGGGEIGLAIVPNDVKHSDPESSLTIEGAT